MSCRSVLTIGKKLLVKREMLPHMASVTEIKAGMIIHVFFNDRAAFDPSYIFIASLLCHSSFESENQCCIHKDGSSSLGRASATVLRMMYEFLCPRHKSKDLTGPYSFKLY